MGGKKGEKRTEDEEKKTNKKTQALFLENSERNSTTLKPICGRYPSTLLKWIQTMVFQADLGGETANGIAMLRSLFQTTTAAFPKTATGAEHGSEARKHAPWWPRLQPLDVDDEQTAAVAFP